MPHHLVGVAEIARMLRVSRQRVDEIATTDPDFPKPEVVLAAGRIWSRRAVERWAKRRARRKASMNGRTDRVVAFFREREGLQIGVLTAAELLKVLGTDEARDAGHRAQITGRDLATADARTLVVSVGDLQAALA